MTTTMKVTSKNQVTFPKKILDALGVKKGDRLKVSLKDKKIILQPEGRGILDLIEDPKFNLDIPKGTDIDELIGQAKDEYFTKNSR